MTPADPGFSNAAILDTIVVGIVPDEITETGGQQNACVHCLVAVVVVERVGPGVAQRFAPEPVTSLSVGVVAATERPAA